MIPDDAPPVLVSAAGRPEPGRSPEPAAATPDGPATEQPVQQEPAGEPDPAPPVDEATAEPGAGAGAGTDELAGIRAELEALRSALTALNGFVDTLHAENQQLRARENDKLSQPVLRDVIKLRDDWLAMATAWSQRDSGSAKDVATKCSEVADDALLILERYGVEEVVPQAGEPFDRRLHRAVGTVAPAEDEDADGTVARARRPGYVAGDRVVRFAEVVTYAAPATASP